MKRLVCLVVLFLPLGAFGQSEFFDARNFDYRSVLPPCPTSPDQNAQELAQIKAWQAVATPEDQKRAQSELHLNLGWFNDVLGFDVRQLPKTKALLDEVSREVAIVDTRAKDDYHRARPPTAGDASGPGYPSHHATISTAWALVLGEILPDQRNALVARALQIGEDRLVLGMHYPSDVMAGRILGAAVVKKMKESADFQAKVKAAAEEIAAEKTTADNRG
jgi:acid phosphatase (class A)